MPNLAALLIFSVLFSATGSALADEYTIALGEPLLGTSIPRGKVTLGIPVNINKDWNGLAEKDRQVWREYTEITDPDVTPPFPQPNIRAFLKKLGTYDVPSGGGGVFRKEGLMLIVRVSHEGEVGQVDLMEGTEAGSKSLTDMEKALAAQYIGALMATKFSPALMKGEPAPSAFIMRIKSVTRMR